MTFLSRTGPRQYNRPRLWVYHLALLCGWTLVAAFSLWFSLDNAGKERIQLAYGMARSHLEKDMMLRQWNMGHGFVYGPVSDSNRPDPNLKLPDSEVRTPSGKVLTPITSSTMIRQVYEMSTGRIQVQGHLTGLLPLRAENAPDVWEIKALKALERGAAEFSEVSALPDGPGLRLIWPLRAEPRCLSCHRSKGFQNGDLLGGLSVAIPLKPLARMGYSQNRTIWGVHLFLWLLGVTGIGWGSSQLSGKIKRQLQAEEDLTRQKDLLEAYNQILQKALECRSEEELAQVCLARAEELTGSPMGWIGEINGQGLLDTIALSNPAWENCRLPAEEAPVLIRNMVIRGIWGKVVRDQESLIANSPADHPEKVGLPPGHPPLLSFLGVPLKLNERLIGMIALGNKPGGYRAGDQQVVEQLAPVIVEALQRKRAERTLKEKEELAKIIMESVGAGVVLIDQKDFTVVEANPFAARMIGLKREEIIDRPCHDFFQGEQEGLCPLADGSLKEKRERVLKTSQGNRIPVLKTVVPVTRDGHPYLLESFVDLTEQRQAEEALSRANARLQTIVQEVGETNRDMLLLRELGELLQVCHSLQEAYPILEEYGARLFAGKDGGVFLINNSENLLEAVSVWGNSHPGKRLFPPEECWALRRGRSHRLTLEKGASTRLLCRHLAVETIGDHLCVPLTAQGDTLGVIHLHQGAESEEYGDLFLEDRSAEFGEGRIKFVESAAEHISLALSNLKLREKLRQQAIRDPLTGLFNKRYLQETLEREVDRSRRKEQPLGVLMLDLDHFKRFNDTYGHALGDELLRAFGQLVLSKIRGEDIACRYGGEEFTLILPDCPLEALLARAEEIRRDVEGLTLKKGETALGPVTVSVGAAVFPEQGGNAEALLAAADAALYRAKKAGRNRVVAAGENPAAGKTPSRPDPVGFG